MWVNPNAHCVSCVPGQVMLGRAREICLSFDVI